MKDERCHAGRGMPAPTKARKTGTAMPCPYVALGGYVREVRISVWGGRGWR